MGSPGAGRRPAGIPELVFPVDTGSPAWGYAWVYVRVCVWHQEPGRRGRLFTRAGGSLCVQMWVHKAGLLPLGAY